jgi:phospholipid/cholesterol/gamma-HCH transport system ATP-binding protein
VRGKTVSTAAEAAHGSPSPRPDPKPPGGKPMTDAKRSTESDQPEGSEVPAVVFEKVALAFDDNVVLREVSFCVRAGRMMFLLGASGAGKSVILKLVLGLLKPDSGRILVRGRRIDNMSENEMLEVRGDMGMLFQETALFDSLTVAENVGYRLDEEIRMSPDRVRQRVEEVLGFIGLQEYIDRMPSELSGGQRRRVAIARAYAARPRHLLIDDPTSGLDPITAKTVGNEIIKLRDLEHVTSVLVTHQLHDAFYVATHEAVRENGHLSIVSADRQKANEAEFIMLMDGRIHFEGNLAALQASTDPYLKKFLV